MKSGGYRGSWTFALTCLVYHATTTFCKRNFDHRNDALGKTVGQMVGAARSARQNIVEGSFRGVTSKKQEAFQYDVARGSLAELAGDYEAFILDAHEVPWSEEDPRAKEVAALHVDRFTQSTDLAHQYGVFILKMQDRFAPWLQNEKPIVAAQSILITIRRAISMLGTQIDSLLNQTSATDSPHCPLCNAPMRRMTARNGPNAGKAFWGCTRYPDCKGTVSVG